MSGVIERCDVLGELARGTMSAAEVEALYDRIMDSPPPADAARLLALSKLEWTAYCQGATFQQLSRWRFAGWPTHCAACGKALFVENYGWLVTPFHGELSLQHIECPT